MVFNILFFLEGVFLKKYVRAEKSYNSIAVPCTEISQGCEAEKWWHLPATQLRESGKGSGLSIAAALPFIKDSNNVILFLRSEMGLGTAACRHLKFLTARFP